MDPIKQFKSIIEQASIPQLKKQVSSEINNLPDDKTSEQILYQIDDVLRDAEKGGRGSVIDELIGALISNEPKFKTIRQDVIAFLNIVNITRQDRDEFFELWRNDNIINIDVLFDTSRAHSFNEFINGYPNNSVIKAVTDTFIRKHGYGVGKGELFLSTFSRKIKKVQKGDLSISTASSETLSKLGEINIELKARDTRGAPRFIDRNVRPNPKWHELSSNFLDKYANLISQFNPVKTGINFQTLSSILQAHPTLRNEVAAIINEIIDDVVEAGHIADSLIQGGDAIKKAAESYALSCIHRYLDIKREDDESKLYGVLMLDIPKQNSFFYTNTIELIGQTSSIDPKTIYPIAKNDTYTFPQTTATRKDMTPGQQQFIQKTVSDVRSRQLPIQSTPSQSDSPKKPINPDETNIDSEEDQLDRIKELSSIKTPT